MTNLYVRSTDGVDTDSGLTWALAKNTMAGAIAAAVAGDTIFVSKSQAASAVANTVLTFPGGIANPMKVIGVDDTGDPEPPVAVAVGASVDTTIYSLTVNGSAYFYGIRFRPGVSANSSGVLFRLNNGDNDHQVYDNCSLFLANLGVSNIDIGVASSSFEGSTILRNSTIGFSQVSQRLRCYHKMRWEGGGLAAGSSAITGLFGAVGASMGIDAVLSGVNLSLGAASMNLIETGFIQYGSITFRNIKLPANWTGKLLGGAPANVSFRAIMHNATSGTTVYPMWEEDYAGKAVHESVVVKSGGANNGAPFSWKVTTSATASYPAVPFRSPEIPALWNTVVGSPVTVSIDIVRDSATDLTDGEIWLAVQYGAETGAMTTFISSAKVSVLAAAVAVPVSTETWTTTGLATPRKQRLSVTFTPARAGFIQGWVATAKPSTTLFIDPKFVVG